LSEQEATKLRVALMGLLPFNGGKCQYLCWNVLPDISTVSFVLFAVLQ